MGFTISNYSLFGLQPQNFYVSIHGTYQIRKECHSVGQECHSVGQECHSVGNNTYGDPTSLLETRAQDQNCYVVIYTIYYHATVNSPVITQKDTCFILNVLPEPANVYTAIYDNIKQQLNAEGNLTITDD